MASTLDRPADLGTDWSPQLPDAALWPTIILAAVVGAGAIMLLAWAYARAEAQVLVPMEYSAFGWAAAVGWLAFGETVTTTTLIGVALIVAACLVATRRAPPEPVVA